MRLIWLGIVPVVLCGCGDSPDDKGACVSGSFNGYVECQQDDERSSCESHNSQKMNGVSWTFHEGKECSDLGFTHQCHTNDYVKPSCP